jgi:anti-sigma factor RsiW
MKSVGRPVAEDDLHAYVDGFLAPEERARIERFLDEHPEAAARVRGWQASREALQRALSGKAREPVPSSLNLNRLAEGRLARGWQPRQIAAAIVLSLALGAAGGWAIRGSDRPTGLAALGMQAAMVQRTFAAETAYPVEFDASEQVKLVGWAEQRLARPLTVPDLSGAGYKLLGGRLVATEAGPACSFLYQNQGGSRVTLLVRAMRGSDVEAPMRPVSAGDVSGFVWMNRGLAFGVVGNTPVSALRDLSDKVQSDTQSGA